LKTELACALRLLREAIAAGVRNRMAGRLQVLLCAQQGDLAATQAALVDCATTGQPDVDSLACGAALDLWASGEGNAASVVLEGTAPARDAAAGRWFAFAVAAQLTGRAEAAVAARRLVELAPRYLADAKVADGRWAWMAIVCHHAGAPAVAAQLRDRAVAVDHGVPELLDDLPAGRQPLTEGWQELLDQGGWWS
jgi:hypothetical protein